MQDDFWIDTTGDSIEKESLDFIQFKKNTPKKKPKKKFIRKTQELEWEDYMDNCDPLDDYILNVQNMNIEESDSEDGQVGLYEKLKQVDDELLCDSDLGVMDSFDSYEYDADQIVQGMLQEDDLEQEEASIKFFVGENTWKLSKDTIENAEKESKFEKQVNGSFEADRETITGVYMSKNQRRRQQEEKRKQSKKQKKLELETRDVVTKELYDIILQNGRKIDTKFVQFLERINQDIHDFVIEDKQSEYTILPAMPSGVRRLVNIIALAYNTKPKISGKKHQKFILLYRTKFTYCPENWKLLPLQVCKDSDNYITGTIGNHKDGPTSKNKIQNRKSKIQSKKYKMNSNDVKPQFGTVVGQGAKPVGETNVGHKMLKLMGWKPGDTLGSSNNDAITEPISVTFRAKRAGLGS